MPIFYKINFLLLMLQLIDRFRRVHDIRPRFGARLSIFYAKIPGILLNYYSSINFVAHGFFQRLALLTQVSLPTKPVNLIHVNRLRSVCGYYKVLYCTLDVH